MDWFPMAVVFLLALLAGLTLWRALVLHRLYGDLAYLLAERKRRENTKERDEREVRELLRRLVATQDEHGSSFLEALRALRRALEDDAPRQTERIIDRIDLLTAVASKQVPRLQPIPYPSAQAQRAQAPVQEPPSTPDPQTIADAPTWQELREEGRKRREEARRAEVRTANPHTPPGFDPGEPIAPRLKREGGEKPAPQKVNATRRMTTDLDEIFRAAKRQGGVDDG